MPRLARCFVIGLLAGAVGAGAWAAFMAWLDHTSSGQVLCYTEAARTHPEHFQRAEEKVSLEEGARLGRPGVVKLGLKLATILALLLITWRGVYKERAYSAGPAGIGTWLWGLGKVVTAVGGALLVLLTAAFLIV
jgi:hypothetical protein